MVMKNRAGLKGQALIVPAIALIIILVGLLAYINIPLLKTGNIEKDIEVRSEIHTMSNALDAAKLYTETALDYSVYQGCYDLLQKGGWEKLTPDASYGSGLALWSPSKYPDYEQFIGNLQDSINSSLELYRKSSYTFLSDYHVDLPSHNISVDYGMSGITVYASSDNSFSIEKTQETGEYIRLQKDSSIQADYDISCYGIYQKGTEEFSQAAGKINPIIQAAGTHAADKPDFDAKTSAFKASIDSAVSGLNKQDVDYKITAEVMSAALGQESDSQSGIEYTPTAFVKFTITNTSPSQQFPVYDGNEKTVAFRPLTLVFIGKFGG